MPTSELRKLMEDIERRRNETAPLKIINEVTPSDPVKEKTPEPLQIDKEALEASLAEMQKLQRSYVDTSDMGAFGKTIEFISRPLRKAMDTTPGRFVQNVSLGGARQILGDSEYGKDFEVSTGSEGADKIAQTVGGFTAPIAMMSLHGQPVGQAVQQTVMANPNLWNVNPNIISALRNIGTGVATMGTRDALSETFNPTWKDYAGSAAYMGLAGPVSSAVAPHVQYMAPGIHPLLENIASSFAGGLAGSVASLPFSWSDLEGEGFQKATSALKKVGVDAGTYALFGTMMMALQPETWGDRSPQMKSAANNMMHSYNKYLEALQAENKTEADKYAKEFQRWGNTFFHYARQVTKQGATSAGGVQILDKQAIDAMKLFGDVDPNTITPENFRQVLDMKLQATPWSAKPGLDASGIDSGSDASSATQQVRPVPAQTRTTSTPVSDTSTPTLATVSRSLVDSLRAFQGASEQNQGVALEEFIQAGNDFKNYVQGYDSLNEHPERNQFVQLMNELNMNAKDFISALQIHGELVNDLANQYDDIPIIEKSDSEVSASNVAEVQTEEPVNIALSQENLPEYNKQLRRFWGSARGKGLTTEESRAIWTMASGKESMKEGSADDFQRAINLLSNQEFNAKEVAQHLLAQQQPDTEVPTEQPKAVVPDAELTSTEQSPVETVQAVDEPNLASGIENSEINLVKPENVDELQRGDIVYDPHGKEFEIVRVNKNSFRVKNAEGLETTLAKSVIRVGEQLPETATTEIAPVEQAEPQVLGEEMVQVDQIPDVEVPGVESPVIESQTEKSDTLLGEVVRLARSSPDQWSFFGDLSERYKDRWKEVVDLLPEEGTNTPDKIFSFWNKATEGGSLYEGETYVEPQGEGTDYTIQPLEKVGNVEVAINENSDKIASVKQGKDGIVVEIGRGRFEEGELNEITLIHEIGHVLSSMHPDLERQIFENPGGALGRVNQQTNQFEGVYGMKTPEESWAESYRAYMMDPADLQKKHPDAFALVEHVLNQIPYHEELHSSILEKGAAALSGSQPPQVPVIDSQTEDSVNLMKLKNIDNLAKGDTIYDPHGREFEIIRVNKNSFRVKDSDGKETTVAKSVAMIRQEDVPQSLNTTIPRTIADVERLFRSLGAQDHHMKTLMGYIENSIDSEGERKFSHFAVNEDGSIDFLMRINMDDQWGQKTVYTNHRVGIVPGRGLYHYRPEHATLNQWLKSHENAIFVDDISIDGKPKPISVRQWETSPQDQATDYNTHLETLNRVQGLSKRLKPLGYRMKGTDVLSADTGKVVFRPNRSDNVHDELDELEHFIQEHEGGTSVIVTEDIPADQKTTVVGASGEPEGETEQKFRSVDAALSGSQPQAVSALATEPVTVEPPQTEIPEPTGVRPDTALSPEAHAETTSQATWSRNPERQGVEIRFSERPEREVLDQLRQAGFRWHKKEQKWYARETPERVELLETIARGEVPGSPPEPSMGTPRASESAKREQPRVNPQVEHIRRNAENLNKQIEAKRNSGVHSQRPTPRRARIAAELEAEADQLEKLQANMNKVADAIEAGTLPESLSKLAQKVQFEQLNRALLLAKSRAKRSNDPDNYLQYVDLYPVFYKSHIRELLDWTKGKRGSVEAQRTVERLYRGVATANHIVETNNGEQVQAIQTLLDIAKKQYGTDYTYKRIADELKDYNRLVKMGIEDNKSFRQALGDYERLIADVEIEAEPQREIRQMERELIGTNIPGYFPTPAPVVDQMIDMAEIEPGMKVLEPSAGKGNIADTLRESGADLDVIEMNYQLRQILEAKGHNLVGEDFLEHTGKYDRIVMNPPFEKGQDIDHVRHAYELLKPGGRIVSVMSEGPFFRGDTKSLEFRSWLDDLGGTNEKLPKGAFLSSERPTGVNTRLVVIDKPAGESPDATAEVAITEATEPEIQRDSTGKFVSAKPFKKEPFSNKTDFDYARQGRGQNLDLTEQDKKMLRAQFTSEDGTFDGYIDGTRYNLHYNNKRHEARKVAPGVFKVEVYSTARTRDTSKPTETYFLVSKDPEPIPSAAESSPSEPAPAVASEKPTSISSETRQELLEWAKTEEATKISPQANTIVRDLAYRDIGKLTRAIERGKVAKADVLALFDATAERMGLNDNEIARTKERIEGAREPAELPERPIVEPSGRLSRVWSPTQIEAETKFEVVSADDILTSDMPGYPKDYQPRQRDSVGSRSQIETIKAQFNPEFLGHSAESGHGAPIVNKQLIAETGNGRSIAIKELINELPDKYEDYKTWIKENAEAFGIDPAKVDTVTNPILVRIRTNELDDLIRFIEDSNKPTTLEMGATEQANVDARRMSSDMMKLFHPTESGRIDTKENRRFINAFFSELISTNEAKSLMTDDGRLNRSGIIRIQSAILAKAYGDNGQLMAKLLEEPDDNVKRVSNALLASAPSFAELKSGIQTGDYHDLDITEEISEATMKLAALREEGRTVDEYLRQQQFPGMEDLGPLSRLILAHFDAFGGRNGSHKKMMAFLNNYVELVKAVGSPKQAQIPGFETDVPLREELIEAASRDIPMDLGVNLQLFAERRGGDEGIQGYAQNGSEAGQGVGEPLDTPATDETGEVEEGKPPVYHRYTKVFDPDLIQKVERGKERFIESQARFQEIDQEFNVEKIVTKAIDSAQTELVATMMDAVETIGSLPQEYDMRGHIVEQVEMLLGENPGASEFHGKSPAKLRAWFDNYKEIVAGALEDNEDITKEEAWEAAKKEIRMNLQFFGGKKDEGVNEWEEFFGELATGESGASTETSPQAIDSEETERAAGIEEVINSPAVQKLLSIGKPKPVSELKKQTPNAKDLKKRIDSELEESDNDISLDPFAPQTDDVADFFATNKRNWKGKNPSEDDPEWLKAKKLRSKRIWEGQPKQRVKIPFSDKELRFVETPGLWRDEKMLGTPLTLQYLTGLSPWDVVGNEITTLGIRANLILHSVNSSVQNEIEKWAEGLTPEQKHELALMMDGQRPITPELAKQAEFLRNEILDKYRTDFGIGGYIPDYMPHVAVDSIDDLLAKQDEALAKQLEGVPGALDYFARHPRTDPDSELMFEDAFEAVSYWFYRGLKATVMDEFLHAIEDAKEIADPSRHKWLDEYGKMVIGVPGSEETFFNNLVAFAIGDPDYKGRHIKQVADTFTELWYDGAMMWNLHSPIKNLTQKSLTIGYLSDGANPAKGVYYWAKGVQMLTTKTGRELLKYSEVLNDRQFLEGIGEREKVLSKFFKPYQKFSEWGWKPYKLSDLSNVSEAYLAGVYKGLERGLSLEEAIRYGDEVVKNTQYTYGTSGLMLFKGPFSRMLGVVNSWPLNWMRLNMAMLQGKGTLPPKAKGEMRKVLEGLEDDLKRLDEEFGEIDSSFSSRKEASGEDFDFVNPSESYEDRFVTINGRKYSKFGVLRVGQTMVAMSLMAALFQKIFGVNFKSTTPKEVTKSSLPYKVATGEYWSPPHETLGKMLKSLDSDNWDQLEEETKNWVLETIDSFVPASNARKRVSRVAEDILNEYWAEDKKHRQVYEKTPWEATRQLWGTPVERYERQNISAEIKSVYLKHFGLNEGKQASRQAFKKDLTEALTHAQKLGYTKEGIEKMAKNAESAVRSSAYNSLWEALEKRDQKEAYKAAMILAGSGANASTIRSSAKNRGIQPQLTNEALHLFNKAKAQIK